jgi:hypothetical protein
MLQSLESTLHATDRVAGLALHFRNSQRSGTTIIPSALQRYEQELQDLATQRERMRELIARWWTLIEKAD